jgi:hypothetical protein
MSTSQPAFDTQQESTLLEEAGVVVDHAKAIVVAIRNAQVNLVAVSQLNGALAPINSTITQLETLTEQLDSNLKSYADVNSSRDRAFALQEIAKAASKLYSRLDRYGIKLDKFGIAQVEIRETVAANNAAALALVTQTQKTIAEQRVKDQQKHADQRAADQQRLADQREQDQQTRAKERAEERAQDKRDRRNALYQMVMLAVVILAGIFYIVRIFNT